MSSHDAALRLAAVGPNELPRPPRRGVAAIALGVLRQPMFLLLVAAALIYLALGDPAEGLLLGAFAGLTVALVVVQQARSERAVEALRELSAPTARVVRDGREQRIAGRAIVPGDLLLVGEGERVAADARLLRSEGLALDESLLTGESAPASKRVTGAGADAGVVHAGTLVVAGHGIAEVTATGVATATGRIGLSLVEIESAPTPLQRLVDRLVRGFGIGALCATVAIVLLDVAIRGGWLQAVLSGIAIAMALLPEEFPMALAVFLALGAWRMAKLRVLARRPEAVETLGATSVLCLDKTGTLTENRMRLAAVHAEGETLALEGGEERVAARFHRLLELGLLASKRQAFDPMDRALAELGTRVLAGTGRMHDWSLEKEYPLAPELPVLARVWAHGAGRTVAAKGAPEAIARLCGLDAAAVAALMDEVASLAQRGLRVIAVATAADPESEAPPRAQDLSLVLVGLLGFLDPPRAQAADAVAQARAAGIAVAMITGDHPLTALAVARAVGIDAEVVLTGTELDLLDDAELGQRVRRVRVFARIRPEQKLRLVRAFAANGEIVAMMGDGVNDAPALKAAHIGLAMGGRGTDVAREAAGIVLLDDDVGHLVAGIRMGRRIFANLRKVLVYIAAIHVPIAGLALLPLLLGLPLLLLPMHVVLIEMVIDPICSIAFEGAPPERDIMRKPPRHAREVLIGARQLALAAIQGLLLLGACLSFYALALRSGLGEGAARTVAFVALTAGNLALVRVNIARGFTLATLVERGYGAFWGIAAVTGTVVAACIYLPWLAPLFAFAPLPPALLGLAVAGGAAAVLSFDLLKLSPAVRKALA